jgi:hypothetical protein
MAYPVRILTALCLAAFSTQSFGADGIKGQKLTPTRTALIAKGWKPRETFGAFADGEHWNRFGDAGELYRDGIIEVESCSGTGLNYCSFNYVRNGKCLSLQTRGEYKRGAYEPTVIRTSNRCPKLDVTRPTSSISISK